MTRDRKVVRQYSPEKMWKPLGKLMASHFDNVIHSGDGWADRWEPLRLMWDQIMDNLKAQGAGKVYGSIETFRSFRFIESLAVHDDGYFRLVACLLSAPQLENFVSHGGFLAAVKDFYLKTYGCAPVIYQGTSTNRVLIRIPSFCKRFGTGHPSPRQFKRDFQKLTEGLWSIEFIFGMDHGITIIEGYIPEGDPEGPHNPGFVKAGRWLLSIAAGGA